MRENDRRIVRLAHKTTTTHQSLLFVVALVRPLSTRNERKVLIIIIIMVPQIRSLSEDDPADASEAGSASSGGDPSSSHLSDTHTGVSGNHRSESDDEVKRLQQYASKETQQLRFTRMLAFLTLLGTGTVVCCLIYAVLMIQSEAEISREVCFLFCCL